MHNPILLTAVCAVALPARTAMDASDANAPARNR